ncbi:MAG TPA: phosphoribosylanthranilate isomerase [Polyangiaceae bacterium]
MTYVKICGVTSVEDALLAASAGADAIGLNFVPTSKRVIDLATAAHIADAVGDRVELIAVVANRSAPELEELRAATGVDLLQLHGFESPGELELLLPHAFKAVAIANAGDAERAAEYGGTRLLVDAKVEGELGGTGQRFDWSLAEPLAKGRDLIVAGGLTPDNVVSALRALRPFGVDVASGVETKQNPRAKDAARVHAFVAAVRAFDASP